GWTPGPPAWGVTSAGRDRSVWRRVGARGAHVALAAQAEARRETGLDVEGPPLPRSAHAEHRARQSVRSQVVLLEVRVAEHHAVSRAGDVRLDHSLHRSSSQRAADVDGPP